MITTIKLGQYDIEDGEWLHRYVINKIMFKTVDVSCIEYWRGNESATRCYRYNKSDLLKQINLFNNAKFLQNRPIGVTNE